jgi:hypothetical protein
MPTRSTRILEVKVLKTDKQRPKAREKATKTSYVAQRGIAATVTPPNKSATFWKDSASVHGRSDTHPLKIRPK